MNLNQNPNKEYKNISTQIKTLRFVQSPDFYEPLRKVQFKIIKSLKVINNDANVKRKQRNREDAEVSSSSLIIEV